MEFPVKLRFLTKWIFRLNLDVIFLKVINLTRIMFVNYVSMFLSEFS